MSYAATYGVPDAFENAAALIGAADAAMSDSGANAADDQASKSYLSQFWDAKENAYADADQAGRLAWDRLDANAHRILGWLYLNQIYNLSNDPTGQAQASSQAHDAFTGAAQFYSEVGDTAAAAAALKRAGQGGSDISWAQQHYVDDSALTSVKAAIQSDLDKAAAVGKALTSVPWWIYAGAALGLGVLVLGRRR